MAILRSVKVLYKDKLAFWLVNFSVLLILTSWVLFIFKRVEPSPLTVLHYNIYSGIDILGQSWMLYVIPGIILLLSFIDFVLAVFFWTKNRLYSYFFLSTIFFCQGVTLFYLYNILNYNI